MALSGNVPPIPSDRAGFQSRGGGDQDDGTSPWATGRPIACGELFAGFLRIGLTGFGGVASVARHEIVGRRGWLNAAEYAMVLSIGKVLPGANTVNAAVIIGDRLAGPLGAAAGLAGLMAMPLLIVVALAVCYDHVAGAAIVEVALQGTAAAAAGMVIGNGARLLVASRGGGAKWVFALLAATAVAAFNASLLAVLVALTPLALLAAWWRRTRAR